MTRKSKSGRHLQLQMDSEVARQIRQHARSASKTEVCGVLIGNDRDGAVEIEACIAGENADEAGAHVTFTQDTWQHIYEVKDKEYPNHRVVGWYHSHPGFGVFLSDHDTFIHKNFFSSPRQVAWVYDPHSDEEGCFGWSNGQIERLAEIGIVDQRGGERVPESGRPEPKFVVDDDDEEEPAARVLWRREPSGDVPSLQRWTTMILSYLTVLLLGFMISWYFFPRLVGVPVDPMTGQPLPGSGFEQAVPEQQQQPQKPAPNSRRGAQGNNGQRR